jgi:uncharacterized membrane protein HdeD (DUF308 family)
MIEWRSLRGKESGRRKPVAPAGSAPATRRATQERNSVMLKSLSTSMIVRGILAVAVGIIALAWPGVTVLALVVLFAVYAFIAAGLQAMRAFGSSQAGPVIGHLLLGLVDVAAGVVALLWPGPTALVLVLIVATWAVAGGAFEFAAAFVRGEAAGTRALLLLGGLVSVAFGVVLFARPGIGAIALAILFGLYNLIYGTWLFVAGLDLRHADKALHPVHQDKQPHRTAA